MSEAPPTLEVPQTEYLPLCGVLSVSQPGETKILVPFPIPSVISVGRSPEADISLKDASLISYNHGQFRATIDGDGAWQIVYQNTSQNSATYINQEELHEAPYPLRALVTLRFGWGNESIEIEFTPFLPESFRSRFNVKEIRGSGGVGDVYVVEEREERRCKLAAKIVILGAYERRDDTNDPCSTEYRLQDLCQHVHVIEMKDILYEPRRTVLITELALGDLADHLTTPFPIRVSKLILAQLASGLDHIHSLSIVHRDLRPANILISSFDPIIVKIGDFGSATTTPASGICGRPQFCAPEALRRRPYGRSVDIWSLGSIAFLMFSCKMPFAESDLVVGANGVATQDNRRSPRFHIAQSITPSGQTLISSMLEWSEGKRATASQVCKHRYLRGAISWKLVLLNRT